MAPKSSHSYHSPHQNLPAIDHVKDELARYLGLANGSHLGSTSSAPFCNPILGLTLVAALIPTLVLVLALVLPSSDKLFR